MINLLLEGLHKNLCLVFEDEFEYNIWNYYLKNKFKNKLFLNLSQMYLEKKFLLQKLGNVNQVEHLIYIPYF